MKLKRRYHDIGRPAIVNDASCISLLAIGYGDLDRLPNHHDAAASGNAGNEAGFAQAASPGIGAVGQ